MLLKGPISEVTILVIRGMWCVASVFDTVTYLKQILKAVLAVNFKIVVLSEPKLSLSNIIKQSVPFTC